MPVFAHRGSEGTVLFTQSRGRGRHWGMARTIFATAPLQVTTGHQLLVLRNDELVDFFTLINTHTYAKSVAVIRSTNRGAPGPRRWSCPHWTPRPSPTRTPGSTQGTGHPASRCRRRPGHRQAISSGRTHATATARSTPSCCHASTAPALDDQALLPSVAVVPSGAAGVSWYRLRPRQVGPALLTDRLIAVCHPVRRGPRTAFGSPAPLTTTPFDFTKTPELGLAKVGPPGYFVGDHMFMAAAGN